MRRRGIAPIKSMTYWPACTDCMHCWLCTSATEEENYFTLAAGGADGEPGRRTDWPGAERLKLWGHSALSPEAPKT